MRLGLLIIVFLALGSIATHFLLEDNGYVLINFRGYAIEMSVPVLVFLLAVCYLILRFVIRLWRVPRQLGEAAGRMRDRRAGQQATKGYIALAEGKIAKGERLLTRGARRSDTALLNYLAAARTAQMQDDSERRDNWLKMAYEQEPAATNAVLLTQAELQLQAGEIEQALASLNKILEDNPSHGQALKLLAGLHERREDWPALEKILPALRKQGAQTPDKLESWTVKTFAGLLKAEGLDRAMIESCYQRIPRALRKNMVLITARIRALIKCGETDLVEKEIHKALKAQWNETLILLYGELETTDAAAHLRRAESWLKNRPEDPVLLLTAGRVCLRNQLWGKARSYLESSLAIRPIPAAYNELGQLMLKTGEPDAATAAFQQGLSLIHGTTLTVPKLKADTPDPSQKTPG